MVNNFMNEYNRAMANAYNKAMAAAGRLEEATKGRVVAPQVIKKQVSNAVNDLYKGKNKEEKEEDE